MSVLLGIMAIGGIDGEREGAGQQPPCVNHLLLGKET
jgi:hypothetical protein